MRQLSLAAGGPGVEATMAGVIVGTVEYMAPEQARGEAVDQRADVYAFGLILYDLLAGRARVHPNGAIAELQARMQQAPPVLKTVVPAVPEALSQLVMRCVDPNPAARFSSAAEIVTELDRLDEQGELIPVRRTVRMPLVLAMVAALLSLSVASWWFSRGPALPEVHDPVSVVIADFQNNTTEPGFDDALEQTVKRALEGADFISAYDRSRIRSTFSVTADLDETTARETAVKQGLGVVLAGSIGPRGNGFDLAIRAYRAVSGDEITQVKGRAGSKDDVLEVATRLVTRVRTALGDPTPDSDQLFAMRSVSATSLDVVGHYAAAMESQVNQRYEEARQSSLKAIDLDPEFGLGYQALAAVSRNLGRSEDAQKYIDEALRHLEGMTERERFVTRGFKFRLTGDYKQCKETYADMTARYAGDPIAFNQLALCSSKLRDLKQASEVMQRAIKILPSHPVFRSNFAIYLNYGGEFAQAEQEARAVDPPSDLAMLAIAFAQIGQGKLPEAVKVYGTLATVKPRGPSWSASGLADLALYQGRYAEAARMFEKGAEADLAVKNGDRAARKLTSLAYAELQQGHTRPAIAAAERALTIGKATDVRFLAARLLAEAGAPDQARRVAEALGAEIAAEPQAAGKIIEGVIALKGDNARDAIRLLTEANSVLDTWLGRFDLGRAYLAYGALPQADSEFDRCAVTRRGEALSLLLDEEPTAGYFPIVYYYQGLTREGLKSPRFADSYRAYLAIRGQSKDDPLLADIRKRAAAAK
jgi:eukaryotic-like serine/threonine-protein kinase